MDSQSFAHLDHKLLQVLFAICWEIGCNNAAREEGLFDQVHLRRLSNLHKDLEPHDDGVWGQDGPEQIYGWPYAPDSSQRHKSWSGAWLPRTPGASADGRYAKVSRRRRIPACRSRYRQEYYSLKTIHSQSE